MAENAVVGLIEPGLDDFGQKVGDAGTDKTMVEIDIGGTGEEILEFCRRRWFFQSSFLCGRIY